jgi:hypothetical protein
MSSGKAKQRTDVKSEREILALTARLNEQTEFIALLQAEHDQLLRRYTDLLAVNSSQLLRITLLEIERSNHVKETIDSSWRETRSITVEPLGESPGVTPYHLRNPNSALYGVKK